MRLKKLLYIAFLSAAAASLYADDFRWNLINALARSNYQEVESLIQNNINSMSVTDKRMVMSFVLTYSRGDTAIQTINMLSNYGITPNSYDLYTALNMNQSDDIIRLILQHGAAPNGEILLLVMSRQRFEFARQFINAGIDVNYSYPLSRSYADGMTPLLFASKWNNTELVRLLIERGANINARSREGETALSFAYANGNMDLYYFLMERGASQSVPPPAQTTSSSGMSALFNNQSDFQRGAYRLAGGDLTIRFTGSPSSGSISYTINGRPGNGVYRVDAGNLTVVMEGRTFIYKIDSSTAFSGNGESWVRVGD